MTTKITKSNFDTTTITEVGTLTSLTVAGNIVPDANVTYNLGSPTHSFKDLYLSGNTIFFGGATLKTDSTTGAVTIVPAPTVAEPNPTGLVITTDGNLAVVSTTGGNVTSGDISNAVANSANYASTDYVDLSVANLVNSAPSALNTLNELANALGNDASFSTTVTNTLANKLSTSAFTYANITGKPTLGNISSVDLSGNANTVLYGNGAFAAIATSTGTITLAQPGNITTPFTGVSRFYPTSNLTITNVFASLGTVSSGNLGFMIKKNGSNVGTFTVTGNTFRMSDTSANISVSTTDYLTLDVTSGSGATDLRVDLKYKLV